MTPKTIKPSAYCSILCLLVLFLFTERLARSAETTQSTPQQSINNTVTAPIPTKPDILKTGPALKPVGNAISPPATASNPNGTPAASCPLSLETEPKGDIRDIRGPIHIPDPRLWLIYAVGAALLLLLTWAIWKWFRNRQSLRSKTPFEIALEELEKAKALMTPEMGERFSVMVSRTIRTYIEKQFGMKATRKTTQEFISQVAAEPTGELNRYSESLRKFLDHCDLAKFARYSFSKEQMGEMHKSARRFVLETTPQPEEKESKKETSAARREDASTESSKETHRCKNRFFKGRLRDGFPLFSKKATQTNGFNSTQHVVTAGGR